MDWYWQAMLAGSSLIVLLSLWMYDFFPFHPEVASYHCAMLQLTLHLCLLQAQGNDQWKKATSIYEFSANHIDGNEVSLEKYKYVY
jgi:hypothetical protein